MNAYERCWQDQMARLWAKKHDAQALGGCLALANFAHAMMMICLAVGIYDLLGSDADYASYEVLDA